MRLPQIRMQSTFAQIDIRSQRGQLEIHQQPAELNIQQPKAEIQVNKMPSRLTIDQTRARADVDLKSAPMRIEEAAVQGQQDLLAGIARRAQDGEELMKIEKGGGAIARQAKRNSEIPQYDFKIGWIPSPGSVQIKYNPGKLDINWRVNKPIIDSRVHQPMINYYRGNVEINMKQYHSLKIDFDNLNFIGINYEQTI